MATRTARRSIRFQGELGADSPGDVLADATIIRFPPGPDDLEAWSRVLAEMPSLEPAICRVADELPNRVDRLAALGNAVVPKQAAFAFTTLWEKLGR